jgi:hypothetical protein
MHVSMADVATTDLRQVRLLLLFLLLLLLPLLDLLSRVPASSPLLFPNFDGNIRDKGEKD